MENYKVTEFLNDIEKICDSHNYCTGCELLGICNKFYSNKDKFKSLFETVYNWSQNQKKTFLEDLMSKFPNFDRYLILTNACPHYFGYCEELEHEKCINTTCEDCWNRKE